MRKIINHILPAALLFTVFACKSNSESRLLKFNLEKGKSYNFEVIMNMEQDVMEQKNKIGFMTGYAMSVLDDNGTIKTLEIAYKDFKMNMNVMGQEMVIDAANKPDTINPEAFERNPMLMMENAFSGIIGKKFTMKVTGAGKVEEISGFEEMIHSMVDKMAVNDEMRNAVTASLKDQFNSEKIKEMFAPMFSAYPNKEVRVGDKWSNSYDMSSQGIRVSSDYMAKSFQGENVIIDVKSKISPYGESNNPALSDMKFSGSQSGTMTMNSKSGLVTDADLTQDLDASGTVKMKMTSKIKMRGKESS